MRAAIQAGKRAKAEERRIKASVALASQQAELKRQTQERRLAQASGA